MDGLWSVIVSPSPHIIVYRAACQVCKETQGQDSDVQTSWSSRVPGVKSQRSGEVVQEQGGNQTQQKV